jgi:pSer/pThr/pTyr-binding forkhead associated (FHA) protein
MQAVLTVMGGVHNGRQVSIGVPVFLIGRDPACHLRPASPEVSRQHCAIIIRDQFAFLRDYGSRNGTTVNHRVLMHGELQLEDGDILEVGPLVFRVTLMHEAITPATEVADVSSQDTAIQTINSENAPGPGDTVMVPRAKLPPQAMKGMRDSPEKLCPE